MQANSEQTVTVLAGNEHEREAIARSLVGILTAVEDTVSEAGPFGAPAGIVWAGIQAGTGFNHEQVGAIIAYLIGGNRIVRRGDCYFPGPNAKGVNSCRTKTGEATK